MSQNSVLASDECPMSDERITCSPSRIVQRQGTIQTLNILTGSGDFSEGQQELDMSNLAKPFHQAHKAIEKQRIIVDQPGRNVDQTRRSTEQPRRTTDQPRRTTDQSRRTTDQPRRTTDQPRRSIDQPRRSYWMLMSGLERRGDSSNVSNTSGQIHFLGDDIFAVDADDLTSKSPAPSLLQPQSPELTEYPLTSRYGSVVSEFRKGREYYDPLQALRDAEYTRAWHVDWMRFVANWLVTSVHFVRTVKIMQLHASSGAMATMDSFLVNLLQIGMPIFFYASGRASGFSNSRNFFRFVIKKCLRLLLPLGVSYFLVLLPAALISGPFYESRDDTMPESTWSNLGSSIIWWFRRFPLGTIEWLWYLPVLIVIGILTYPYCLWINTWHLCTTPDYLLTQRDSLAKTKLLERYKLSLSDMPYSKILLTRPVRNTTLWVTVTSLVTTVLCYYVKSTYRMKGVLLATYSISFIIPPFILAALLPLCRRWNWRTPLFIIFPVITIVFAFIKEDTFRDFQANGMTENTWAVVMSLPYYISFYLQGHLEQRLMHEWEHYERMATRRSTGEITASFIFRPFKVIIWVALWANGSPGYVKEYGYMWAYPLYTRTYTNVSYVLSSWIGLHFWERFMAFYARTNISPSYHKHVTNMSLIVYIFHGLHIAIVGRILVWHLRHRIEAIVGIIIFVVLVIPMTFATYFLIINVPPLATVFGLSAGFSSWKWSRWGKAWQDFAQWSKATWKHHTIIDETQCLV